MYIYLRQRRDAAWTALVFVLCVTDGSPVPAAKEMPQTVIVATDQAPLQNGREVVARVKKGAHFKVENTNGDWYLVRTSLGGKEVKGWIHKKHVREAAPPPAPLTPEAKERLADEAKALREQADQLAADGKHEEAVPLHEKVVSLRKQTLGPNHADTAEALRALGAAVQEARSPKDARPYFEEALEIRRRMLGDMHVDTAHSLLDLGQALIDSGELDAAERHLKQALAVYRRQHGENHDDTANAHVYLSLVHREQGDYAAARRHLESVLAIFEAIYGKRHEHTGHTHFTLGLHLGDPGEAQHHFEQAAEIFREAAGEEHIHTVRARERLGVVLFKQGEYAAARRHFEWAATVRQKSYTEEQEELATALTNLGVVLEELKERAEARKVLEQALAIRKKTVGEKHADTASTLHALGTAHAGMGEQAAARGYYEQALAIRRKVLGESHRSTALSLNDLALSTSELGDWPAARKLFEQSLAILKAAPIERDILRGRVQNNLGQLLIDMGEYAAALVHLRESLAIRQKALGERHPEAAAVLNRIGIVLEEQGYYADAKPYYEQALSIWVEHYGERSSFAATGHGNLGNCLSHLSDFAPARRHLELALELSRELHGENHPDTALSLNCVGSLLMDREDFAEARFYLQKSLDVYESLGEMGRDAATTLSNLGVLHHQFGDLAAARSYQERALKLREQLLGRRHPETAFTLHNLASVLHETGNYAAAKPLFEEVLRVRREMLGMQHADTAQTLNNLAMLLLDLGDHDAARRMMQQSLAVRRAALGDTHPETANAISNLGVVAFAEGDLASARRYFQEAIATREADGASAFAAFTFDALARTQAASNDWRAAAENIDKGGHVWRRYAVRVLPTLPEREQLAFLVSQHSFLGRALSLGMAQAHDSQVCSISAACLVNGKSGAQEALALRSQLQGEAAETLLAQLRKVRGQLARVSYQTPPAGQEKAHQANLARLREDESRLIGRIGELTLSAGATDDPWIPLERVRKSLPPDAVHVNIARFYYYDFTAKVGTTHGRWGDARYTACIIPPQGLGDVKIVDLGDAPALDAAVQAARQAIQHGAKKIPQVGEPAAERECRPSLRELAKRLLDPLLPHVGDARHIILSPDGQLWLAPWSVLPLESGKYAIERFELSYVVSGRELADRQSQPDSPSAPLVVADPDFDLGPATDGEPTTRGATLPRFSRLPATAAEAREITPSIESYVGITPQVRMGDQALEQLVKSAKRPQVLTLSTHGFFLADQQVKREQGLLGHEPTRSATLTIDGSPLENPLLRCGLALAGCNRDGTAENDGVLTGLEIVGLNLRGTELVVLSACETGIGEVRNGEGVAGLRQAFQLAGAEAVVASLWSVPDLETARLMKSFFQHLAQGKSKSSALRAAQLERIASRRERFEAAHPFYWAAFTVTGR